MAANRDKLQKISDLIKEGITHLEKIEKDLELLYCLKQDLLEQLNEDVSRSFEDLSKESTEELTQDMVNEILDNHALDLENIVDEILDNHALDLDFV